MKEMKMLDLDRIDLGLLCTALDDHSPTMQWWLDPETGEAIPKSEDLGWGEYDDVDPERLIAIEPTPSGEGYGDMEDFIARVRDPRARDLLARAIAGRGAFRRFKDTLFDLPELREAWFRFRDARAERRAIAWLDAEGLVAEAAAEAAIAARPDPDLPEISGAFDAHAISVAVAGELKALYGERLRRVILFGSWARGDAHPESDIDLLVVLDGVASRRAERRRMSEILYRHSLANDTVVTAIPVGAAEYAESPRPTLVGARSDGMAVG